MMSLLTNQIVIFRQRECLRHFIVVLTEQGHLSLLCDYNYTGLEEEVTY